MDYSTHRCAVYLDKGGVGKSTSAAHLGVAAAEADHEVLLVGLSGKQRDLAIQFGIADEIADWPNVSTMLSPDWEPMVAENGAEPYERVIYDTGEGPDLIPSHPGLDGRNAELKQLYDDTEKYELLDRALSTEYIEERYDLIVFDLPGAPSVTTYNGLWAAENVLVPVLPGPFEARQAVELAGDIKTLRTSWNRDLRVAMLMPTMTDDRTRLTDQYAEKYGEAFGARVAPSSVPFSQDVRNAQDAGRTVFALDRPSNTAEKVIEAYRENVAALMERLSDPGWPDEDLVVPSEKDGGDSEQLSEA